MGEIEFPLDYGIPRYSFWPVDKLWIEVDKPYFNHVSEFAWILAENTDGLDVDLVIAGLLDVGEITQNTKRYLITFTMSQFLILEGKIASYS